MKFPLALVMLFGGSGENSKGQAKAQYR